MLEILGLTFIGLIILVCLIISGSAFSDWMDQRGGWRRARMVFWITFLIGAAALIWFSYLSSGANVWALNTPPLAGV